MKSTTRDNIIYLTIATGIIGLIGIIAWYQDSHGIPIHMPISDRAAGFFITTAVVFGYTVQCFRKLWSGVRFWLVLSVIMAIYLPLQWRLVQATGFTIGRVSVITFVELLCILFVVEKLVPRAERPDASAKQL